VFAGLGNPTHILFIVVIALLVFGPSQLPKIARSAGKGAREARDGVDKIKGEFESVVGEDNPLVEVADTLRSANPRSVVRDAVSKAASPPKKP
jgi:sec-independent protein translocase protein TatA